MILPDSRDKLLARRATLAFAARLCRNVRVVNVHNPRKLGRWGRLPRCAGVINLQQSGPWAISFFWPVPVQETIRRNVCLLDGSDTRKLSGCTGRIRRRKTASGRIPSSLGKKETDQSQALFLLRCFLLFRGLFCRRFRIMFCTRLAHFLSSYPVFPSF